MEMAPPTALTMGSLTFSGSATAKLILAGGSTTTSPALVVTNTLANATGRVTLNVDPLSPWVNGDTYDLIQYGSFNAPNLSNFTVGSANISSRQNATLGIAGSDITLTIMGDSPEWTGLDSTSWNAGSTGSNHNWQLISALTATDYIDSPGDAVTFNDTATSAMGLSGNTIPVAITVADVHPISTTFNDSTYNYTVSGTNAIAGSGLLAKYGTATVTINNANTYTGATTIYNGTLHVNGSLAAGSAVAVGGASGSGFAGTPTLAGSGTMRGPVTVFDGNSGDVAGHLAPSGFNGTSYTTLNLAGALTLGTGASSRRLGAGFRPEQLDHRRQQCERPGEHHGHRCGQLRHQWLGEHQHQRRCAGSGHV